jgi:hypothetical protein
MMQDGRVKLCVMKSANVLDHHRNATILPMAVTIDSLPESDQSKVIDRVSNGRGIIDEGVPAHRSIPEWPMVMLQ